MDSAVTYSRCYLWMVILRAICFGKQKLKIGRVSVNRAQACRKLSVFSVSNNTLHTDLPLTGR